MKNIVLKFALCVATPPFLILLLFWFTFYIYVQLLKDIFYSWYNILKFFLLVFYG